MTEETYGLDSDLALEILDDPLVTEALDLARTLVPAERWSLLLPEPGRLLRLVWPRGPVADLGTTPRVPIGEGPAGTVAETGTPLLVQNATSVIGPYAHGFGSTAYLCVPVPIDRVGTGVLCASDVERGGRFRRRDVALLSQLGRHLGRCLSAAMELRRAQQLAQTDPLTGLLNQRYFWKQLSAESARAARTGTPLALALVDIIAFKRYNDDYGHHTGDIALRTVAQALTAALRPYDTVSRGEGDEFAIILPGATGAIVARILQRCQAQVVNLWSKMSLPLAELDIPAPQLRAGIATTSLDITTPEDLFIAASEALQRAHVVEVGLVQVEPERLPDELPLPAEPSLAALAAERGISFTDLATLPDEPGLQHLVPVELARRLRCVPVAVTADTLTLAIEPATPAHAPDDVAQVTGLRVVPVLCHADAVAHALATYAITPVLREPERQREAGA